MEKWTCILIWITLKTPKSSSWIEWPSSQGINLSLKKEKVPVKVGAFGWLVGFFLILWSSNFVILQLSVGSKVEEIRLYFPQSSQLSGVLLGGTGGLTRLGVAVLRARELPFICWDSKRSLLSPLFFLTQYLKSVKLVLVCCYWLIFVFEHCETQAVLLLPGIRGCWCCRSLEWACGASGSQFGCGMLLQGVFLAPLLHRSLLGAPVALQEAGAGNGPVGNQSFYSFLPA